MTLKELTRVLLCDVIRVIDLRDKKDKCESGVFSISTINSYPCYYTGHIGRVIPDFEDGKPILTVTLEPTPGRL